MNNQIFHNFFLLIFFEFSFQINVHLYVYMHVYVYVYLCLYMCVSHVCVYVWVNKPLLSQQTMLGGNYLMNNAT